MGMAEHQAPPVNDLVELGFELLAERGWRRFSIAELASRADITFAAAKAEVPTRWHLLQRLHRRLDAATFDLRPEALSALEPRDRVFDLIMRRLDAAAPFKPGLRRLSRDARQDPALVLLTGAALRRFAASMLDVAGTDMSPLRRRLAASALATVYLRVFNVWLDDDTEDQARTLSELDRRLSQAERMARFACGGGRRRGGRQAPPEPAPFAEPDAPPAAAI